MRSSQPVQSGDFVAEFVGEICKFDSDNMTKMDYMFKLYELNHDSYCLDATNYGNIGRFFNHSCDPNIRPIRVSYDHNDFRFPNVAFFALRDIAPFEELTYDYGDTFWSIRGSKQYCNCNR